MHGFVGEFDVQAVFVSASGMDGDGGDAHFTAGTQDAQGDFRPGWRSILFFSMIIFPDGSDGLLSEPPTRCGFFGQFLYWLKA